jgi:hypothetical protein
LGIAVHRRPPDHELHQRELNRFPRERAAANRPAAVSK